MNRNLPEADKKALRERFHNKVWDVGYYLLAYGVRGEDFEYIMQGGEDVNCKSHKQRQAWLAGAMERMDERLAPERVVEIRQGSACCLGGERNRLAKQIHDAHDTVDARFEAFSKARYIIGDTAQKIGEDTYRVSFWEHPPEKGACSCLKYVPKDKPMPKSWCACCAGHIKRHFETALGVRAECECVSSQLTSCGKEPCAFRLTITERL